MKLLAPLLLLAALAAPAAAQYCDTSNSCFFPPGPCAYLGIEHVTFSNGWQLTYLDFENAVECDPLPPSGGTTNQQVHSTCVLKLFDGSTTTGVGGQGLMTMHLFTVPPSVNPREVDLELLALDLSTLSFPSGVKLRESPTIASTGHMQQSDISPGNYHVTSFFDVFFELSTDGGQSWFPANGPVHTVISPAAPLPARAATWGGVKATYR